jgi:hypothetical protein
MDRLFEIVQSRRTHPSDPLQDRPPDQGPPGERSVMAPKSSLKNPVSSAKIGQLSNR